MSADRRSSVVFWGGGLVLVALVSLLLVGGTNEDRLDPRSVSPDGAKGLVDLIESFGADVALGRNLPADSHDVAVLFDDSYGVRDRSALEDWVERGGTLVVTDPGSALSPRRRAVEPDSGTLGCRVAAFVAVEEVAGLATTYRAPADAASCFGGGLVVDPVGSGLVVSLGGPGPFLNKSLDEADNAVLAVSLLVPRAGTEVAFLEPALPVGVGGEQIWDLIADPVWMVLIQLGVAFVLIAWWKARRLGNPVPEPTLVLVESSEIAAARGRLFEHLGQPMAAAVELRADTRRRLARQFGLPLDTAPAIVAERVAAATAVDGADAHDLLDGGAIETDTALVELAQGLARLRSAVLTVASEPGETP